MSADGETVVVAVSRKLPVFLTSFVGRVREIQAVADLLSRNRMVTITGPGGIGKTRLAVKLAEGSESTWPAGVGFVDYTSIDESATALGEVASALGLVPMPGLPQEEQLLQHLSARRLLLLLDNCERLLDPIRKLVLLVLQRCPDVSVVATSRERLVVPGEVLYQVQPLSKPPVDAPYELGVGLEYEALELFAQRASANRAGFRIAPDNLPFVLRICSRLDGNPLALELAAARLRVMSPRDLDDGLQDRFPLLRGGAPGRHESLWTAIDWSYQLLDEGEQQLFQRLSVFAGGFRLDAAGAVAGDLGSDLIDAIGNLVDKSLLQLDSDTDGRSRYRMLDSIRDYGFQKLRGSAEVDEVRGRHLCHYLDVAQEAAGHAESPAAGDWLDRLQADHDNMVAAITWSHRHAPDSFVRLVSALGWYWQHRRHPAEGRRWLEAALELARLDVVTSLDLLRWATVLAAFQDDSATAKALAERSLGLAEQSSDTLHEAHAHLALGNLLFHDEDPAARVQVREHYESAHRLYEEAGAASRCIPVALNLSIMNLTFSHLEEAHHYASHALQLAEAGGWDELSASALIRLGLVAYVGGDDRDAEHHLRESVRRWPAHSPGGPVNALHICLLALAAVKVRQGRERESARLAGAAAGVAERGIVQPRFPRELLRDFDHHHEVARHAVGTSTYDDLWESGRLLSDREARLLALSGAHGVEVESSPQLTNREMEIVDLVANGLTNRRIGARLGLSTRTVDAHLDHIRDKLGLRNRAQIVRWLLEGRRTLANRETED
jgi:non-specific serine/threonine protein kinase